MPRVPSYQPNQIGPVRANEERLRAFDDGGGVLGAIGQGLGQLAGQASKFAADMDAREAQNDDTQARQIAADKGLALSNTLAQYKTTEAGAARAGQQGFNAQTQEIWDNALKEATTPRMRGFVQQRLEGVYRSTQEQGFTHAIQGAKAERSMAFDATSASWAQQALITDKEDERDNFIASGVQSVLDKAREIDGVDLDATPEVGRQRALAYTSKIHDSMGDKLFAAVEPDIIGIGRYLEKYGPQMTPEVQARFMARLREPLQNRMAAADADHFMGLAGPAPDAATTPGAKPGAGNLDAITEHAESTGKRYGSNGKLLTSRAGAMGEMQVMPATAADPGFGIKAWDKSKGPSDLARVGREYRAVMERRYGGDLAKMWGAYNAGPGTVDNLVERHGENWLAHAPAETKAYVKKNVAAVGGSGTAYQPTPKEIDRGAAYAAVNQAIQTGQISAERGERALKEIDRRSSINEGLLRDQYADAETDFEQFVAKQPGGALERWGQVPAKIASRLDPKFVAKQQQDMSQREAKKREEDLAATQLQQGILAGVVDPADGDVKKAGDALYVRELSAKRGINSQQKMAFDVAFAAKVGFVPPALKGQLVGQLRSANPKQQAYAAAVIAEMGLRNSAILNDFSDEQIARAQQLKTYQENGFSPEDASQKMADMERVPQSDRAARKSLFSESSKKAGDPANLLKDAFGQNPSPTLVGRFNSVWQSEFERTGDIDVARATATATLRKEWSVSKINGSSQLMRFAPERYYGVSDKGSQDAKWIREQAVHDLLGNGMSEPNADERLRLQPYGTMNGQPVYIGVLQQPDGTVITLSDTMGRPKRWRPDFKTSEEAKRQQRTRNQTVQSARADRAASRAPSRGVDLLRMLPGGNKM